MLSSQKTQRTLLKKDKEKGWFLFFRYERMSISKEARISHIWSNFLVLYGSLEAKREANSMPII